MKPMLQAQTKTNMSGNNQDNREKALGTEDLDAFAAAIARMSLDRQNPPKRSFRMKWFFVTKPVKNEKPESSVPLRDEPKSCVLQTEELYETPHKEKTMRLMSRRGGVSHRKNGCGPTRQLRALPWSYRELIKDDIRATQHNSCFNSCWR